jgi:hypothetical protein
MKRLLAVGLVLLALGSCAGATLAVGPTSMGENPHALSTPEDFDRVQFRISVFENGSARWTFQYQRTLGNETERQQFEEFATHFNGNETDLYTTFQSQASTLARAGANATGRDMEANGFTKQAEIGGLDGNLGIVRMSFVWTNFAAMDGDRLVVGDVFEGGLYIGPNQSLVVEVGDGVVFAEALPEPDSVSSGSSLAESESITWEGEQEFADQRPRVVFEPAPENTTTGTGSTAASPTPSSGTDTDTGTGTTAPPGEGTGNFWMMAGAGFVLVVGLVAALLWFGADDFEPSVGGLLSSGDDGGSDGPPAPTEETSPPSVPDEELLTDEARVLQLLEDNGGRMKQVNIVEETGWSKSKVSMLLSEMADQGEISKLRMGRENIISLDGHEPDAARSPYEED